MYFPRILLVTRRIASDAMLLCSCSCRTRARGILPCCNIVVRCSISNTKSGGVVRAVSLVCNIRHPLTMFWRSLVWTLFLTRIPSMLRTKRIIVNVLYKFLRGVALSYRVGDCSCHFGRTFQDIVTKGTVAIEHVLHVHRRRILASLRIARNAKYIPIRTANRWSQWHRSTKMHDQESETQRAITHRETNR